MRTMVVLRPEKNITADIVIIKIIFCLIENSTAYPSALHK